MENTDLRRALGFLAIVAAAAFLVWAFAGGFHDDTTTEPAPIEDATPPNGAPAPEEEYVPPVTPPEPVKPDAGGEVPPPERAPE